MTTENASFTTRVYKYGVVFDLPVARDFPQSAINELFKANRLWNQMVEIHRDHQAIYEQARRDASYDYRSLSEAIDDINEKIKQAYDVDMKQARLAASSREKTHPFIMEVQAKIDDLKAQRKAIGEAIKRPRNEAKALIDSKGLDADFWNNIKSACHVENSQIDANIANEIQRYFKTARQKAFADRSTLRFHSFDGTGFWHWRLRLSAKHAGRKVTSDGVKWAELFPKSEHNKPTFCLNTTRFVILYEREIGKGRKQAVRACATLAGKGKDALRLEFDILVHRNIPENAQIQNAQLMRTRTGDQFKYHICFTVREPEQLAEKQKQYLALGIDLGFRQTEDNKDVKYNPLKVAHVSWSDARSAQTVISLNQEMVKKANLLIELQRDLDQSATELGERIVPLLKGVTLPNDYERRE